MLIKIKASLAISVMRYLFMNIILLISLILMYVSNTWGSISMSEIIFHITHSIEGVGYKIILSGLIQTLIPLIIFNVAYIYNRKIIKVATFIIISSFIILAISTSKNLKVLDYIIYGNVSSNFIDTHYLDPKSVEIVFKEKRNLIYIYVESMEKSFTDKKHGGYFDENIIPELTKLAEENIIKKSENTINGAYCPAGTTWTMAGVFAQSTGLPLILPIQHNSMSTQKEFFPDIIGIGDILQESGYYQEVIMGTHASFSGLNTFFKNHGKIKIVDYKFMHDNDLIPKGYKSNSWGIDDNKLFSIAKKRIIDASKRESPFNITVMTFNTHFDLKISKYCDNKFDNEYKNIIYCSDNLIASFINWIQQQPFYKNTTIIVSGDHLSMKGNLIVNREYKRKIYNIYINSYNDYRIDNQREYSQFDIFPTTMASIGAEISGERLGLGTNLFGSKKTLTEIYGYNYINSELSKQSTFFENKMNFELDIIENPGYELYGSRIQTYGIDDKTISIEVDLSELNANHMEEGSYDIIADINYHKPLIAHIYQGNNLKKPKIIKLKHNINKVYSTEYTLSNYDNNIIYIQFYCQRKNGRNILIGSLHRDIKFLIAKDFNDFIDKITDSKYSIFITLQPSRNKKMVKEMLEGLRRLGLMADFPYNFLLAYCAVIDDGKVVERNSTNIMSNGIEILDTLARDNKIAYAVRSDNLNVINQGASSIYIGGYKCSKDTPGLNIVVYDNELHKVVDSTTF